MPTDRTTALVIGVVGLLVLTAAAASLANPTETGGGIGAPGDWSSVPTDDFDLSLSDRGEANGGMAFLLWGEPLCLSFLFQWEVQLLLIGLIALSWMAIWRRTDALLATGVVGGMLPLGVVAYLAFAAACEIELEETPEETRFGLFGSATDQANTTVGQAVSVSTDPLVVLLLLAVIGLVAIGIVAMRDDVDAREALDVGDGDLEEAADRAGLALIAGETARRLEEAGPGGADLENEVYRAWVRMTAQLDVDDPATATPRVFARAAVDAGMAGADVDALTALFEAVRYGDRPVTAAREERAIELLRRIERSYGPSP